MCADAFLKRPARVVDRKKVIDMLQGQAHERVVWVAIHFHVIEPLQRKSIRDGGAVNVNAASVGTGAMR